MGQTWDKTLRALAVRRIQTLGDFITDVIRAAYVVIPIVIGTLTITAWLARTGHTATMWLWLTAEFITGIAIARTSTGPREPRHHAAPRRPIA